MRYDFWSTAIVTVLAFVSATTAKEGEAVKGLAAKAEVVSDGIRLTLKNVSDKPLAVCTWLGQQCIEVSWIGPDGKPRESHHYDWLKAVRLRNITADDFVTLKPGESIVIGPRGKDSDLKREGADAGKHRVTISYRNVQDGKAHAVQNVWTGKVTAKEVTVAVK
jgi:hypothetical protein